jgi:hypothetical protein
MREMVDGDIEREQQTSAAQVTYRKIPKRTNTLKEGPTGFLPRRTDASREEKSYRTDTVYCMVRWRLLSDLLDASSAVDVSDGVLRLEIGELECEAGASPRECGERPGTLHE